MKIRCALASVAVLLATCSAARATVVVIDSFGPASGFVTTVGGVGAFISSADFVTGGLDGQRDIVATRGGLLTDASTGIAGGLLTTTLTGVASSSVHWDGAADVADPFANNAGLSAPLNVTLVTGPVFRLYATAVPTVGPISLTLHYGVALTETVFFGAFVSTPYGLGATIPFAAYTAADLTAITGITLKVLGVAGSSTSGVFDSLVAGVPEPASVGIFGSLMGLTVLIRRRRKS